MPYAVQQDLVDRFGSAELIDLTDRADPPAGAIDATVLGKALDDADELIDSYIANRYDLPLATVPAALVKIAADIASYYLFSDSPTEQVRDAFEDAVKLIKDISAGRAKLDVAGAEPAREGSTIKTSAPARVFTETNLKSF